MGSRRVPASRQTAGRIEELLAGGGDHDVRSDLIRLGVRKLVEEVLEAEVEDRLGRVEGRSLAQLVREAIDAYLLARGDDVDAHFERTAANGHRL